MTNGAIQEYAHSIYLEIGLNGLCDGPGEVDWIGHLDHVFTCTGQCMIMFGNRSLGPISKLQDGFNSGNHSLPLLCDRQAVDLFKDIRLEIVETEWFGDVVAGP